MGKRKPVITVVTPTANNNAAVVYRLVILATPIAAMTNAVVIYHASWSPAPSK